MQPSSNTISLLLISLIFFAHACTYTEKIRDGATAYEVKQFAVAAEMLKKEYKKTKSRVDKGKIAYMLAESYKKTNRIDQAAEWYLTAYDNSYGVDALKGYAFALKQMEEYDQAAEAFKNLGIEIGSPYEYRKHITACRVAKDWKSRADQSGVTVEASEFNSSFSDYAPTLYGTDQLVFTSDRGDATGEEAYNWTGFSFTDLFISDQNGTVQKLEGVVNTPQNEGTAVFTKDGKKMYFSRCFSEIKRADQYCKLMVSTLEDGQWSEPELLPFVKEKVNYAHPAISEDGRRLYFTSDDKEGWGGYDIYFSTYDGTGWGEPKVLSRSINTLEDDMYPVLDADTLYFASSGHTGMGGLDIFRSYQMPQGRWSPTQNLLPPINSGADDFAYVKDPRKALTGDLLEQGYFTSSRSGGPGNDDIYRYERRPPPPPPEPEVQDTIEKDPEPIVYKLLLKGYVLEKIFETPDDPDSRYLGRKPLPGSKVQILVNDKSETVEIGGDGLFELELEQDQSYTFFANKEGYLTNDTRFSTVGIGQDPNNPVQEFEVEIVLDKIYIDREIVLENIYYDFDESFIREDAKPNLDELFGVLTQNPTINIQISSHTDCRGRANYNERLSQDRAQSVVDYLIGKGISPARLSAKGYGKSRLAIECVCSQCTEDEHQANRRTTFKILADSSTNG